MTWAGIMRVYDRRDRPGADRELEEFAGEKSLSDVLARAGMAETRNGRRFDHQRRLSRRALVQARDRILAANWEGCASFAELISRVHRCIGGVSGIGELMVYDTALRIGAWLGLEPDKVYLHAGTRQGAKALGLDVSRGVIEMEELPEPLQARPAKEVEDILCIFKHRMASMRSF